MSITRETPNETQVASAQAIGAGSEHRVRVLIVGLAGLTALYAAWPLWRAQWLIQMNGDNEAWNAFHVDRLLSGLPLYPGADELIANNYPPLSFLLIGGLSRLAGDPIVIGRALSLLATLASAGGVAAIVRILGAGRTAATVGALWFVATMARSFDRYVGMNDPHLVAMAAMISGLTWALHVQLRSRGAIELPFALMAIAGFYKHTLIAFPLAALVWLLLTDRRLAIRAAAAGTAVAIAGVIVCRLGFGGAFVDQLTAPRVVALHRLVASAGQLQWVAAAFVIWAWWACTSTDRGLVRFTVILIAASFGSHLLQQLGEGVDYNSQFELVAALGVAIALVYDRPSSSLRLTVDQSRVALLAVLIARLLLVTRFEPFYLVASPAFRAIATDAVEIATRETQRIAALPGKIACSNMVVCRAAGKAFVFDAFAMRQRVRLGHTSVDTVRQAILRNGIRFEEVDFGATMDSFRVAATLGARPFPAQDSQGTEWGIAPQQAR